MSQEVRAGAQDRIQYRGHRRVLLTGLLLLDCSVCFLLPPYTQALDSHSKLDFPQSSSVKKVPHWLAALTEACLNWISLQIGLGLCRGDKDQPAHEVSTLFTGSPPSHSPEQFFLIL